MHLASKCLTLQRLLRQPTPARLLERPSEPKVAQVGCLVGPPITGQLTLEGIPRPWAGRRGGICDMPRVRHLEALQRSMGPLEAI